MSKKIFWISISCVVVFLTALIFTIGAGSVRFLLLILEVGAVISIAWLYLKSNVGAFDRMLAKPWWVQLSVLAVFTVIVLAVLLSLVAIIPGSVSYSGDVARSVATEECQQGQSLLSKMIATTHRFFGFNYYPEDTDSVNFWMLFLSLIGSLLVEGLLITTLSNSVQQQKENVSKGLVHYRGLREHVVVIGYGPYTVPLVSRLLTDSADLKVLIMTSQTVEPVRSTLESTFDSQTMKRVFLYSGSMLSDYHLGRLNISSAKEVYLLGEYGEVGGDSSIIECARRIRTCRWDGTGTKPAILPVHLLLEKPAIYSSIREFSFPDFYYSLLGETVTYLRPFNIDENSARLLWGYQGPRFDRKYPDLDFQRLGRDSGKRVHLVIAGFNGVGRALLLEAVRICHFPNYQEGGQKNKTLISVVDPCGNELKSTFFSQYSGLDLIEDIEIEFVPKRVEDIHDDLIRWATGGEELLTLAFCFFDPDASFAAALHLPEVLYFTDDTGGHPILVPNDSVRILINQPFTTGISDILKNISSSKYRNVYVFGNIDDALKPALFDDTMPMMAHAFYSVEYYDKNGTDRMNSLIRYFITHFDLVQETGFWQYADRFPERALSLARQLWNLCDESIRYANRYQIEMYGAYQKYESTESRDLLMEMEHRRWMAERVIVGFKPFHHMTRPGTVEPEWKAEFKRKKNQYKLHNLLVPFSKLPESEKSKDQDVIYNRKAVIGFTQKVIDSSQLARYDVNQRYVPTPLDLDGIELSAEQSALVELLAENLHEVWARKRMNEGWKVGALDEKMKTHPDLRPYGQLSEEEKELDLANCRQFIRCVINAGYGVDGEVKYSKDEPTNNQVSYNPQPIDVSTVTLGAELNALVDTIARNAHEVWAKMKLDQGWVYGPQRDDQSAPKRNPDLVPYDELPESEKEYDVRPVENNLKVALKLGYRIFKEEE